MRGLEEGEEGAGGGRGEEKERKFCGARSEKGGGRQGAGGGERPTPCPPSHMGTSALVVADVTWAETVQIIFSLFH